MPEPKIERYEVIVPVGCKLDDFGNLTVTTDKNEDIKVNKKHASLHQVFQDAVPTGQAVRVGYAVYMDTEYVQTAELDSKTPPVEILKKESGGGLSREFVEKQASIERQNAYSGAPALVEVLHKYPTDQFLLTAKSYGMSKLQYWASMGDVEETETEPEAPPDALQSKSSPTKETIVPRVPMSTLTLQNKMVKTYKDKGYSDSNAMSCMVTWYKQTSSIKLTKVQIEDFIKRLEKGEGLEKEVEPEDIPF